MGLTNITGIFSRFFVVGFYLPSFFASFAVYLIFDVEPKESKVLVVGGVALLVALLALGFRNGVWFKIFSGYTSLDQQRHMIGQRAPIDPPASRAKVSRRDRWFVWNRFRWATVGYRKYVMDEYGLDTWIAWPFIEAELTPREQELHADALANVHFFQNMCLGAVFVGIAAVVSFFVDAAADRAEAIVIVIGCLVLTYLFYLGAVGAVASWGENKIVAALTHRHALYKTLGVPVPADRAGERAAGDEANTILYPPGHQPPAE
jgi:hypothetical protein